MTEGNIVQVLVQGGSVGVALLALWIIYKQNQGMQSTGKEIADSNRIALENNTQAWVKNTEALTKLNERLK